MRRAAAVPAVAAMVALASPAAAGEIAKAVVVLESLVETLPGHVPEAAPPRFVLLEDGQVFVGGTSRVLTAKLGGSDLRALQRRLDEVRKLPGLAGTISIGPGEMRQRLLLRRGRPIQMTITGDPAQPAPAFAPLAALVRDLPRFHHAALKPYRPAQYALSAREAGLVGGCRPWPFPEPLDAAGFAARLLSAEQARGWPTGAAAASVCAGDRRYVVTLRPLLPGETP